MKKSKWNEIGLFVFVLFFGQMAMASTDIPVCGGAVVPDHLPSKVMEASTAGESVVLKQASQDKTHVIDIAFVYGSAVSSKGKLMQNVEAAVLRANIIFQRSGVNARLRTVAVQPDRKYGISLDQMDLGDALVEIGTILPKVRADYGADLIYALTTERDLSACGRAFLRRPNEDRVFAAKHLSVGAIWVGVNNEGCLRDNFVLAHEVGHNLGLTHDEESTSFAPFVPSGRGYSGKNVNNKSYSTVMGNVGNKIYRFSSGLDYHDGVRIGSDDADAAKALLYTIEDASNYSPTKVRDSVLGYECTGSETSVCLQNGRFRVEAFYKDRDSGDDKSARFIDAMLGDASSLSYFFSETNPELMVKVIDGCGVNGKYWVFGSAATDLDYQVLVTDNATGVSFPYYRNASDPLISDTGAFPCHP